jgi:hypothetical protein
VVFWVTVDGYSVQRSLLLLFYNESNLGLATPGGYCVYIHTYIHIYTYIHRSNMHASRIGMEFVKNILNRASCLHDLPAYTSGNDCMAYLCLRGVQYKFQ